MKVSTNTYRKLRTLRPRPATSSATQAAAVSLTQLDRQRSVSAATSRAQVDALPLRAPARARMPSSVCQPPSDSGAAMPMPCSRVAPRRAERLRAAAVRRAPISSNSVSGSGKS